MSLSIRSEEDDENQEETSENTIEPIKEKCKCFPTKYAIGAIGFSSLSDTLPSDVKLVDFGEVIAGQKATQIIEIKNKDDCHGGYNIFNVTHSNDMYQYFNINRYNFTIPPQASTKLKITYKPFLENEKSSAFYHVLCSKKDSRHISKIWLKGRCLGTSVKCSTRKLYFLVTPSLKNRKRVFELTNVSKIPANFQFVLEEDEEVFRVEPENGEIQPKKSLYVSVTFNDEMEGLHYKRLVAIIDKHEPIMIDIVGLKTEEKYTMKRLKEMKFYPKESKSNYSAFFQDYGFSEEKKLPFEVKKRYFDFGKVSLLNEEKLLVAVIKNCLSDDIKLNWYKDSKKVFSIRPEETVIRPDQSSYFEVKFKPTCKDQIFYKTLTAQVSWSTEKRPTTPVSINDRTLQEENVPLPLKIIVFGHSFPENKAPLNNVETIPAVVTFPATIPGFDSYTTFRMKTESHLPVLFKLIPPKESNFLVEPMIGLVKNTKLMVAKLVGLNTAKVYKEDWTIELNGQENKSSIITLQGVTETPSIEIGNNNIVSFNTTLPGCQDVIIVPVKNTCCFNLSVNLIEKNEFYHTKPKSLILYPDEEVNTEWTLNGRLDLPSESKMKCTMRVMTNFDEIIGMSYEMEVTLRAGCEFSQICATPRYKDFGDLPCGSRGEVEFKMFNFGKTVISFTLQTIPTIGEMALDVIKISVEKNQIAPNENVPVKVWFETKTPKERVVQIVYYTRVNRYSQEVTKHSPVDLFALRYNCILPSVQVEECVEHNLGIIFSKVDIWNMFLINELNEKLLKVSEDERKIVNIILPSVECHDEIHKIRFVLRNRTKFDVRATLSRIKTCMCEANKIVDSISIRKKVYECPHRTMVTMRLSDETIVGNSFQFLDFLFNFKIPMTEGMAFDMKLTENRHIHFVFHMNNIPRGVQYLSLFDNNEQKKFLPMFIGAKAPPYQIIWLYNNTSTVANYSINDKALRLLRESEGFPVISCFNSSGTIEPQSAKAVLFRFQPIEAKKYEVNLPMELGQRDSELKLSGRGNYKYDRDLIHKFSIVMPRTSLQTGDLPVTLSVDYLIIEPFVLWNTVERLIFIKNVSKDRVFKYTWQQCLIDGIIEITTDKPSGKLEPDEVVGITLQLRAFGNPAISNINLTCKILDITQKEIHEKSINLYKENQERIEQYFTIDEKGCHLEENKLIIEPPSEEFYLNLAISFHTISVIEKYYYVEVEKFLSQNPLESFEIEMENFMEKLFETKNSSEDTISCRKETYTDPYICQIMECLIMDTLKSSVFQEMISCQVKKATPPYYIQFKQEETGNGSREKNKKTELKQFYARSSIKEVSETFKSLIKDSIEQIYF